MKQESLDLLQNNIDELTKKYDTLVKNNSFGEALNVMKNIDALTRQLDFIGQKVTIKPNNNDKFYDWYNVLKFFIETKQPQLIQLDYSTEEKTMRHRCTGKTTALTRLSIEYNIPILSKQVQSFVYKDRSDELQIASPIVISDRSKMLLQYTSKKIFLVDEFELPFEIDKDKYILIGFERKCD